jgi:fibronectin-binding autotransporter adhesin
MLTVTQPRHPRRLCTARILTGAVAAAFVALWSLPAPAANITTTWNGSAGDWFDPTKWSAGIPANDATNLFRPILNSGTVTLNTSLTTSGLSLAAPVLLTLTSDNTYSIIPTFTGTNSIAGQMTLQSGALLDVTDYMTLTNATLSGDGTYRQRARTLILSGASSISNLVLDGGAALVGQTLTITRHADFLNFGTISAYVYLNPAASLNFAPTNSAQAFSGVFVLSGQTSLTHGTLYGTSGATVTNNGTFAITGSGGDVPVFRPVNFTNNGTINVTSGILDLSAAVNTTLNGLVSLDANSLVKSKAGTTLAGTVTGAGAFQQTTAPLIISGSPSVSNFLLDGGAYLAGAGTLTITHHADFVYFGNNSPGVGVLVNPDASLTFAATSSTQILSGNFILNGLTTVNPGTVYNYGGNFTNSGTFTLAGVAGATTIFSPANFSNTGTISLSSAFLNLALFSNPSTISGYVTADALSTLRINSNIQLQNLTLQGPGLLDASAGAIVSGESFVQNASLGSLTVNGILHLTSYARWTDTTTTNTNYRIFIEHSAQAVLTGLTLNSSGTLTNNGQAYLGIDTAGTFLGNVTLNAPLINNGTLTLECYVNGTASITNYGVLTSYAPVFSTQRNIQNPIFNSGTISGGFSFNAAATSSGMLSPDAGPFARTLTLAGPLTLLDGAIITSTHDGFIQATASPTTLSGRVQADHFFFNSLAGNGTLTLLGNNTWNSGSLTSAITLHVSPSASLVVALTGAITSSPGSFLNDGTVYLGFAPPGYGAGFSYTVDPNNAGFVNNGTTFLEGNFSGTGTVSNNGLLVPYYATPLPRDISANLVNSATVSAFLTNSTLSGQITLSGRVYNYGLISGAVRISGTLTNSGTVTGAAFITAGGSSSGLFSGDSPAGPGTLTIAVNGYTLNPGARISSTNGTVNASGRLVLFDDIPADHFTFGAIDNHGTLTLSGPNVATHGTVAGYPNPSSPLVHILPNGTLTLGNSMDSGGVTLSNLSLLNEGAFSFGNSLASISLTNATINNPGTLTVPPLAIRSTDASTFFNSGLVIATPNSSISTRFYNSGTVTLSSAGAFTIAVNMPPDSGSASGLFIAALASSTITLGTSNAPYILNNATLSGPGLFTGYVKLLGAVAMPNAAFSSITGPGTLDVSGSLALPLPPGLTLANTQLRLLPTATLSSPPAPLNVTLDNATFVNQGAATVVAGTFNLRTGANFSNQGTLTLPAFQSLTVSGVTSSQFANAGLLNITGNLALTNSPFSNTGTLNLSGSGVLSFAGGTLSGTIITSGNADISCGTSVYHIPNVIDGAAIFGSANAFTGTVTLAHPSTAEYFSLGTFASTSGAHVVGPGSLTISKTLHLVKTSGTALSNGASVTVLSSATLMLGYTYDAAAPVIDNASILNQGSVSIGPVAGSLFILSNGASFTNAGSFAYSSSTYAYIAIGADAATTNAFINNANLSLALKGGTVSFGSPVYNSGTISLSMDRGTITFGRPFFNTGSLTFSMLSPDSPSAYVNFTISGGGSASGFIQATNSGITFSAPYTLVNATLSGAIANTAPLTLLGNVNASNFAIVHNLLGSGSLSGGGFAWNSGTISNSGGVLVSDIASHTAIPNTSISANAVIIMYAGLTRTLSATTLQIAPHASVAAGCIPGQSYRPTVLSFANGAQILNDGTFYSYLPNVTFANTDNHSANAFINTGTFGRANPIAVFTASTDTNCTTLAIPFHNSGLVDIQQGFINFAGGYFDDSPITSNTADFQFAPNTGLFFSGGNYDFGDSPFDLGPGGLFGTGTVHANFASAGTISPGNSPGTLTIDGDLALAPPSTTLLELSFANPSAPQADALIILGNFTADGTLSLTLLAGTPDNSPFTLISAASFTGAFANAPDGARLIDTAGSASFLVSYSSTALTLSDYQPVPEPLSLALLTPALLPLLLRRRKARSPTATSRALPRRATAQT